jgi:hypothetical protein
MRPALSAEGELRAATLDLGTPSDHDDSPAGVRCDYLRLVKPRVVMRYLNVVVLLLAACVSTSRVFEVKPGVYSVSTTGDGFSSASRVREHVLESATSYCVKQGKQLKLADEDQAKTRMGIDTTISVTFTCVSPRN